MKMRRLVCTQKAHIPRPQNKKSRNMAIFPYFLFWGQKICAFWVSSNIIIFHWEIRIDYSGLRGTYPESGFFAMWTGFLSISSGWCVVSLWFFIERKDMFSDKLLNILNMVIRRVENFLGCFENFFHFKNRHFWSICQPDSESGFLKNLNFFTFPVI